jgi:hypothetical protein
MKMEYEIQLVYLVAVLLWAILILFIQVVCLIWNQSS